MTADITISDHAESGITYIRMSGLLQVTDVDRLNRKFGVLAASGARPGGFLVLADVRNARPVDSDARQAMMAHIKAPYIRRYAIWGIPKHRELFMKAYFKVAGIRNYRIFRTEREAYNWLKDGTDER